MSPRPRGYRGSGSKETMGPPAKVPSGALLASGTNPLAEHLGRFRSGTDRDRHHLLAMKVVEAAWMFRTCAPGYRKENENELIDALWELRNFESDIGLRR